MKVALLEPRRGTCYPYIGLLVFAVHLFLALASLAQLNDTRIVFMSNRSGNSEIYLMKPDGKRIRRLTKHPQYDGAPAWSPDGQKITFSSFRDVNRFRGRGPILGEIYLMNPDGTNPINLTQAVERADGHSSWSPDGKQIAFASSDRFQWPLDIWAMDADGSNPHNLTNHYAQDRSPDWSPDGNKIAFESDRNKDWEFEFQANWEVYVMNADGTNPINLTNHPAGDGRADWSPDGNKIVFVSNRDGNLEVYVMDADGTNPINLSNHPAGDYSPDWSPDGRQIAFSSTRDRKDDDDKNVEIYVMNDDGTNPINLSNHPAIDNSASWGSIRPLNVSSNGRLVTLWGGIKRSNTYKVK